MDLRDCQSRRELMHVLNERGLTRRGVEVGVLQGHFACEMLEAWQGELLFLVDLWAPTRTGPDEWTQEHHDAHLSACLINLLPHRGRYWVSQGWSHEQAATFPDASLDFVYIDADHAYESVQRDLASWYPKLVPGGLLSGHDYVPIRVGEVQYGVVRAVIEFAAQHSLELVVLPVGTGQDLYPSWACWKPS